MAAQIRGIRAGRAPEALAGLLAAQRYTELR
jgi:hypothetical protein